MAKYFRYFPTTYYIQNQQQADIVTDILALFAFEKELIENDASYNEYDVTLSIIVINESHVFYSKYGLFLYYYLI